ncbi:MAG: A/G-specific adenine glycosylase [Nitrospirales bacterium]|nr:A/G-specific adenine glycosylase [Nitrospirales bacterium]
MAKLKKHQNIKKSKPYAKVVQGISKSKKVKFQRRLLAWYGEFGRDLPWRRTTDPYKILVSEIMLQQTQVDRVIPKFHEFLGKYPTLQDLAVAHPDEVRRTWYPLGYNIRPYRLHGIACETIERYGGAIPNKAEELLSLKGIGRYTAGAIRSFAFNKDAPILDTNVMRVLHRIFIGKGEIKKQKAELWVLSETLIPRGKGYDFNQALMDFGAMMCTARKPICLLCPMRNICLTVSSDER